MTDAVTWPMVAISILAFLTTSGLAGALVAWIKAKTKLTEAEAQRDTLSEAIGDNPEVAQAIKDKHPAGSKMRLDLDKVRKK